MRVSDYQKKRFRAALMQYSYPVVHDLSGKEVRFEPSFRLRVDAELLALTLEKTEINVKNTHTRERCKLYKSSALLKELLIWKLFLQCTLIGARRSRYVTSSSPMSRSTKLLRRQLQRSRQREKQNSKKQKLPARA